MRNSAKPLACLSIDLDNEWSYLKTRGDLRWSDFPSYIPRVVPRMLSMLTELDLKATVFIVGQDAEFTGNHQTLRVIREGGNEVANHSQNHEPWLHRYSVEEIDEEIGRAEAAIELATGARPVGFRGPGYSLSLQVLEVLVRRGYRYDASTLPTFLGPLARAYYFMRTPLTSEQRVERARLFGSIGDGLRPIKPYCWKLEASTLLEIPVTTFPVIRAPFHVSYILYLSTWLAGMARLYWRMALQACRWTGLGPSILLHPLDFLGPDDVQTLSFFPGMDLRAEVKLDRVKGYLADYRRIFKVLPISDYAQALQATECLKARKPDFPRV